MQPIKILNVKRAVSKIKYIGDGQICVIDEDNTVRIYDVTNFKLTDGFKIKLPKNNPQESSVDISNNGKYIAIAIRGKHKTTIWSLKEKKLIYTLGWHKGDILSVNFDREEKYLMTGGEDGRAYIWSMTTGKMVSSLPPHADYITSVAFSKNCLWGATGSYDKSVTITNISSMDISYRKKVHKGAVTLLRFMDKQRMVSGDKTGELVVWNYAKGRIDKRLIPMVDKILDATFNSDESFMFVVCNTNKKVSLYSMEDYELISEEFIKMLELPSRIEYIPELDYLVVGTFDGGVYFYDLFEDEKKLKELIDNNEFEKAYELVNKNPFLKRTKTYEALEDKWNKLLVLAQKKFEKGETDLAKQILAPFLKIPSKRSLVQSLFNDFSEFEKFKKAVLSFKYPLAYSLVTKYPYLKNTIYYKKMEDDWKKVFNKAKELIFQKGKEDEVREVLKPFRGVTEKTPFIQTLFNEKQLYQLLQQKLQKKEFADFFALINRFPFLSDSDEYEKAIKYGESLKQKAYDLLKKGEYKKVVNIAELLEQFPMFKEEVDDLKRKAKTLLEFHRVLATHDLNLIENYVKEHPFLEDVEDYQEIEKEWRDKLQKSEIFAAKGNVKEILNELNDYMKIKDKRIKIGQIVKSAYLQQIISLLARAMKGQNVSKYFEKAVKNYIKLFGFDMEISDLIDKAKKLKLDIDLSNIQEGDLTKWHLYKLPEKIWEDIG
ncbi:WD40 repeat domain-containing protein [Nautilia lithotrophica]